MLLRLTEELRAHVLMYLDPWTLWRASLASNSTVPAEVIAKHAAKLQRLQPEVEPPLTQPLGAVLQQLVLLVAEPIRELHKVYMEFPGFVDEVYATVHMSGRKREHNTSRQQMLRSIRHAAHIMPKMTERSGGASLAIGRSILRRFARMYRHDQTTSAAAAILSLGSYCYEVFFGYWNIDDYAFLHVEVCGIAGVVRLIVADGLASSGESEDELHVTQVQRPRSSTSDETYSEWVNRLRSTRSTEIVQPVPEPSVPHDAVPKKAQKKKRFEAEADEPGPEDCGPQTADNVQETKKKKNVKKKKKKEERQEDRRSRQSNRPKTEEGAHRKEEAGEQKQEEDAAEMT